MMQRFRDAVRGIKNLAAYAPLVWRDRDWDYGYLLALMEFKLTRMGLAFTAGGFTEDKDRAAAEMIEAAEICQRVRADDYGMAEHAALDKELNIVAPVLVPYVTREMPDAERVERRAILKRAVEAQLADLDRLGELFSERLLGWWD